MLREGIGRSRFARGSGGPSLIPGLLLDFTGGNLDPGVTFTRASNATVTRPDGTLGYAPHNLLTHSEQFDSAQWVKGTNCTVTANAAAAPDGTNTADLIVSSGSSASANSIRNLQTTADPNGLTYTFSVWLRADAETTTTIRCANAADGDGGQQSVTVTTQWQRFSVSRTFTATSTGVRGVINYQNPSATIYAWGAQLNIGPLQPYYPTTVKNLLGFTQEFDNASWTKSNSLIQTNAIRNNTMQGAVVGSPGTLPTNWSTFTSLTGLTRQVVGTGVEDGISYLDVRISGTPSGSGSFNFYTETSTAVAALTGQTWTTSAYFKLQAGSLTGITSTRLYFQENSSGGGYLTEQNITVAAPTGASLAAQRFTASRTLNNASTAFLMPGFNLLLSGAAIDITLRIGLPQLVQGATAGDPVATYGTARAVMYSAPDGSLTADKLVEDTAANFHRISPLTSVTVVAGTTITTSVYAKAAERSGLGLFPYNSAAGARFNLATGTVISQEVGVTASIVSVGNGWYRCSASIVAPAGSASPWMLPLGTSNATNYTGDGTSGIYIWGAQLSDSASLDPYVYNPGAAPAASAYYGPRFDYDPVTLAPKGLLIEEQRTNLLWPSADYSGASWTRTNVGPVAGSVTAPDGSVCGAYGSTDPSSILKRLRFNHTTTTAGSYTWSIFLRAGTEDSCAINVQDGTGSNGAVMLVRLTDGVITVGPNAYGTATGPTASVQPVGGGFYRIAISVNFVSAVTQIQSILTWDVNGASTTTGTLFPWGAQLEAGAFATSYIPTTTAAATRAADVAVMTGANFSSWYRQDEQTFFAEYSPVYAASATVPPNTVHLLQTYNTAASTNNYAIRGATGTTAQEFVARNPTAGSQFLSVNGIGYAQPSVSRKVAFAINPSALQPATNGVLGSSAANNVAAAMAQHDRMDIGTGTGGTPPYFLNGHIRRIAYYPRRLSNAELQGITS